MASHKLVDIDKRRNRICIGETAYLKALRRSLGAIEKLKVTFGEKMNRIIYRRMLSEPPLKCVPATGFSNELNGHPAAPVLFFVTKTLGYGTGSDLRDHSVEIGIANWNSHEAPNLAHAIGMAFDNRES
ncbi:MAG: hypothetical protein WAU42_06115 [Solirubrobacteraceae bacterium]